MQINSVNFQTRPAFGNNPYKKNKEVSNETVGEQILLIASKGCDYEANEMKKQDYVENMIETVKQKGELFEKIALSYEPKDREFKDMIGKHIRTHA